MFVENLPMAMPAPRPLGDDAAMRWLLPVGRSPLAIAAGYAGLFGLLIFPAPIALILGLLAVSDLRRHKAKRGWGRAIFGLSVGALGTLFIAAALLRR